jgi:hypothetical protein
MSNQLLITLEILLTIVTPLLFLYLKGTWALRNTIPCLLSIPVLWYLTYSPQPDRGPFGSNHMN